MALSLSSDTSLFQFDCSSHFHHIIGPTKSGRRSSTRTSSRASIGLGLGIGIGEDDAGNNSYISDGANISYNSSNSADLAPATTELDDWFTRRHDHHFVPVNNHFSPSGIGIVDKDGNDTPPRSPLKGGAKRTSNNNSSSLALSMLSSSSSSPPALLPPVLASSSSSSLSISPLSSLLHKQVSNQKRKAIEMHDLEGLDHTNDVSKKSVASTAKSEVSNNKFSANNPGNKKPKFSTSDSGRFNSSNSSSSGSNRTIPPTSTNSKQTLISNSKSNVKPGLKPSAVDHKPVPKPSHSNFQQNNPKLAPKPSFPTPTSTTSKPLNASLNKSSVSSAGSAGHLHKAPPSSVPVPVATSSALGFTASFGPSSEVDLLELLKKHKGRPMNH